MRYGFGVDIGGTTVKLAFFEEDGTMVSKWEIPTRTADGGAAIVPDIAAAIEDYLTAHGLDRGQILGVGVGVPGPVIGEGTVNRCANLGWGVKDLHRELSQLTGFPVRVGNDANVAALGECWKGGGEGVANMVMVTLGTGVGGGIVVNGRLIGGVHGAGGEIGHMVLNPAETAQCGCKKRGCAEQYCSATGVVRLAKRHLSANAVESTLRGRDITCKDVFDAAQAGDEAAQAILEQVYEYLGRLLANICVIADPEIIVIGGGVSKAGQPLLDGADKYFQTYAFHACRVTKIVPARLGNDAGSYGAFKLILDAVQ